jgi:hypothetical protein
MAWRFFSVVFVHLHGALMRRKDRFTYNIVIHIIIQQKLSALCYSIFLFGTCDCKYDAILVKLNLSTLQFRRRFLDALCLASALKSRRPLPFLMLLVYVYTDEVNERLPFIEVSPLGRCVSAANVARCIDIRSTKVISLTGVIDYNNSTRNNI